MKKRGSIIQEFWKNKLDICFYLWGSRSYRRCLLSINRKLHKIYEIIIFRSCTRDSSRLWEKGHKGDLPYKCPSLLPRGSLQTATQWGVTRTILLSWKKDSGVERRPGSQEFAGCSPEKREFHTERTLEISIEALVSLCLSSICAFMVKLYEARIKHPETVDQTLLEDPQRVGSCGKFHRLERSNRIAIRERDQKGHSSIVGITSE